MGESYEQVEARKLGQLFPNIGFVYIKLSIEVSRLEILFLR